MLSKDELVLVGTMLLEHRTSREIRQTFKIGCGTLTKFRKLLSDRDLRICDLEKMKGEELQKHIYDGTCHDDSTRPLPVFEEIYKRLKDRRLHDTLHVEWLGYKAAHPDGYQYSRFCELYRKWESDTHPGSSATAPIRRNPGEFLYIDWVGDTPALIRDPSDPGKRLKVHFLVTTLGVSSKTFAIGLPDEKTERFLTGLNEAIAFYGALPRYFRPDNMKTAVISNTSDGLVLSTAMEDLQNYYDTPVLPARPLAPKDKATVERAVQIIEKEFIAPSAQMVFESFEDLNKSLSAFLDQFNDRIKKPERKSRNEMFNAIDRPVMRELTQPPFQIRTIMKRKVANNCHVSYRDYYYSVPYQMIGKEVLLKISDRDIIVCDENNQKIAEHILNTSRSNRYTTNPNHLPSQHQAYAQISARTTEDYLKKAEMIGPNTKRVIERVFMRSRYPEQEYKTASGIIYFCDKKPKSLMEKVSDYCLIHGLIGLKHFKEVYAKIAREASGSEDVGRLPQHNNLRGKEYYR